MAGGVRCCRIVAVAMKAAVIAPSTNPLAATAHQNPGATASQTSSPAPSASSARDRGGTNVVFAIDYTS